MGRRVWRNDIGANQRLGMTEHSISRADYNALPPNERRQFSIGWGSESAELKTESRSQPTHKFTYIGLFLFTFVLYFRPYEMIPGLSGFQTMAWQIASVTALVYLLTQFSTAGNLTVMTTEVKCILFMAVWGLITVPIAISPALAWENYSETFIKVVLVFVMLVNVLQTRKRIMGLMWLGIGIGSMLSYEAFGLYRAGVFEVEGYRVGVDAGGMFGNPNDLSLHLVIFIPIAVGLALGSKGLVSKGLYFAAAGLMMVGIMVTQSRGGFLGLIAVIGVLTWKIGRRRRVQAMAMFAGFGIFILAFAPGGYLIRIMSIFIPGLDPVGSSDHRWDTLIQSIWVSLRNPWGIGMGNYIIVGSQNLVSHNAYTQVSAEMGLLAFVAYVTLVFRPVRSLGKIVRSDHVGVSDPWLYYVAIGLQASILGFAVASFFASVAYLWFVYYPAAFAICLWRLYAVDQGEKSTEAK